MDLRVGIHSANTLQIADQKLLLRRNECVVCERFCGGVFGENLANVVVVFFIDPSEHRLHCKDYGLPVWPLLCHAHQIARQEGDFMLHTLFVVHLRVDVRDTLCDAFVHVVVKGTPHIRLKNLPNHLCRRAVPILLPHKKAVAHASLPNRTVCPVYLREFLLPSLAVGGFLKFVIIVLGC